MARRLAAIMFTDIVGFTASAQADEAGALGLLREQENLLRPLLVAHHGRKVKSIGDGLLLEFPDALDAVECGVELQRRAHDRRARENAPPLRIRVGIHLGDVQRRGTDILGDAVNIASRIEPLAEPGGVCLSAQVFDQVFNKVGVGLEKLGPRLLKGVLEPVDIYRVVFPWSGKGSPEGPLLPRLAVLPLTNISPDPSDEYFAEGMTEELIAVLSQIRGLRVISHTSVRQYKGTTKPAPQIGAELGAESILEGSVRKSGDRLRITVQLIDARTDEHRWAQTYDRTLENVFTIQAEVAERTAGELKVELLSAEREALQERPTASLVAYELYLRGIQAVRRFGGVPTLETDREVEHLFEAATREDPRFSAAYAYLANHLIAAADFTRPAKELFPRARELVAKSLELNPRSADGHTAAGNLAMQADLDWPRAEEEFERAIYLNPSSSVARTWYGYLLAILQRYDEAKKQDLAAIELDPLWPLPRTQLVYAYVYSGETDAAIAACESLLTTPGHDSWARDTLAWAYAKAGRAEDALRLLDALKDSSDPPSRMNRAADLALLGRYGEARALLSEWEQGRLPWHISEVEAASWYGLGGETEKALDLLERNFRTGDRILWAFYQQAGFDRIRSDPRFLAMLKALNLPTAEPRPRPRPPARPTI